MSTTIPADLAAAMETVRNTAYGRTYVRRTADGEQRSYLDDCELLARWLVENAERLRVVPGRGDLWSFLRDVLSQGAAIQMDYAAGKYGGYEAYSARVDAAASERADQFAAALWPASPEVEEEK